MPAWGQVLWVILPYIALTVFVVANLYRLRIDPYGWTTRSSELLEKRWLRWGSLLFHWGILGVFLGHIAGLLVPRTVYDALGVSDEVYHLLSLSLGSAAGIAAASGGIILLVRRATVPRVRRTSQAGDFASLILVLLVIGTGLWAKAWHLFAPTAFEYRDTIGPWVRGLLTFRPDPRLMTGVPLPYQIHALAGLVLLAAWPFTRLVHAFSLPLGYLWRTYVLYRRHPRRHPLGDEQAATTGTRIELAGGHGR